jgi:xanthine dehydrogenase accessory factor
MKSNAELTIALGPGAVAGVDCDLVIEAAGPDPGAVIRSGRANAGSPVRDRHEYPVLAPVTGSFQTRRVIGEVVAAGDLLGLVDDVPMVAPRSGRLRGLQRSPRSVRSGEVIAEIAGRANAQVSGIDRIDQLVARSVEFAIELEQQGSPIGIESVKW